MDAQELFNKAAQGIINQGYKPSVDEDNCCVYDNGRGLRCAAGHLLTKEELIAARAMEGSFIEEVIEDAGLERLKAHSVLIGHLQEAHDNALYGEEGSRHTWERQMRAIAERFNLDPSVLDGK